VFIWVYPCPSSILIRTTDAALLLRPARSSAEVEGVVAEPGLLVAVPVGSRQVFAVNNAA